MGNAFIMETVKDRAISMKFFVQRVFTVTWHSFKKAFLCHFFAGRLNFFINGKHIKQSKIVISAKSSMLTGTLCFCCAKAISFSLAKQCYSFK